MIARTAIPLSLLLAALAGCGGPVPPGSAQLLVQSAAAYQRGDDRTTVALADRFIAANPKAQEAGEAYYLRGLSRNCQGDGAGAEQDFRRAAELTRRPELAGRAELMLARLAEQRGDESAALAACQAALAALPPKSPPTDEALFRLGDLLQRQGRWMQADPAFDRLLFLFGDSPYAPQARLRTRARAWTVQVDTFPDRRAAEAQAAALARASLPAQVTPVGREEVRFAVQIGRYETYRQAAEQLPAAQKLHPAAAVTTTREAPPTTAPAAGAGGTATRERGSGTLDRVAVAPGSRSQRYACPFASG